MGNMVERFKVLMGGKAESEKKEAKSNKGYDSDEINDRAIAYAMRDPGMMVAMLVGKPFVLVDKRTGTAITFDGHNKKGDGFMTTIYGHAEEIPEDFNENDEEENENE